MATPYITIGCPTNGGGQVISGNSMFLIDGIPVACVGDKATCPTHKVVATIVSGDPYMQIFGKAAARVNDSLSCGCKLLPQQNLVVQDNGGGSAQSSSASKAQTQDSFVEDKPNEIHKVQFKLVDVDTDQPLSAMLYEIHSKESGKLLVQGYTDKNGMTAIYESEHTPESVELITIDLSKTLEPL